MVFKFLGSHGVIVGDLTSVRGEILFAYRLKRKVVDIKM